MNAGQTRLLTALLSQPTAPFRETHVVRVVSETLKRSRVPHFQDPLGNLVVGAASRTDYLRRVGQRRREPLRLFIAHMDHPGFHGRRWLAPDRLQVRWHGGSPVKHLAGAPVWLADEGGRVADGRLTRVRINKGGWAMDTAEVVLPAAAFAGTGRPAAKTLFGGFRFRRPVWRARGRVYAGAADDLAGVFVIVETARQLWRGGGKKDPPFLGLLTRAEEVGFVGAVGHLELGWLQGRRRPVVCVSLEASRALPGAEIGKGPVVRLGDRRTVFSADALKVLADVAQKVLPRNHQRRVMDGGACEATAATVYGLPTVGISIPLGNYHNQGLEGGPDCRGANGPAPEFVSLADLEGELKLCKALMRPDLDWSRPWQKQKALLQKNLKRYRPLL